MTLAFNPVCHFFFSGGDIEMSTNLMAGEPALAQQDLSLKLNFQKAQLDRKLTELGYAAIMVRIFGGGVVSICVFLLNEPRCRKLHPTRPARFSRVSRTAPA